MKAIPRHPRCPGLPRVLGSLLLLLAAATVETGSAQAESETRFRTMFERASNLFRILPMGLHGKSVANPMGCEGAS